MASRQDVQCLSRTYSRTQLLHKLSHSALKSSLSPYLAGTEAALVHAITGLAIAIELNLVPNALQQ